MALLTELDPSRIAVQALRIVQTEIELICPKKQINPLAGRHGKVTEMYCAMMILEHVIAYLWRADD